jgi:peptidylprolyl isomerase
MLRKTKILVMTSVVAALTLATLIAHDISTDNSAKASQNNKQASTPSANDIDMKKLSEAFGHFIGRNLKSPGVSFDLDSIIQGMREGAAGKPSPMSDQEYEAMMLKVQELAFNRLADDNLKAADDFMAKNAQDSNLKTIVPGKLQYLLIQEGTGPAVQEHGTPSIKYTAKYIDGTVFDSSEAAGGAITIPLDQTIPGFSKGIVGMKEGEKRKLFVHPDLAYGKTGQLPPNSALVFDVEVIKAAGETKNIGDADDVEEEDLLIEQNNAKAASKK